MATRQGTLTKRDIVKSFEGLPDDATIEDFIEHLHFLVSVEQGLADLNAGRVITHEELVERVKQRLE